MTEVGVVSACLMLAQCKTVIQAFCDTFYTFAVFRF